MRPDAPAFLDNLVLFGRNSAQGIVAVEPIASGQMKVIRREGRKLVEEAQEFRPLQLLRESLPDKTR